MHGLFSLGTFQVFTFCCALVTRTEAGSRWLPDWVEDSDRLFGQVQGSQRLRKIGLTGRKQSCSTGGCWCRNIVWQIFLFRKNLNSCSFHKPWHAEGKMKASELRSARDLFTAVTCHGKVFTVDPQSGILHPAQASALCLVPTVLARWCICDYLWQAWYLIPFRRCVYLHRAGSEELWCAPSRFNMWSLVL